MFRAFLYSKDFPQGKIFEDEDEFEAALDSGDWFTNMQLNPDPEREKAKKPAPAAKSVKKGK